MMLWMIRGCAAVSIVGLLAFAGCGVQSATLIGDVDGGADSGPNGSPGTRTSAGLVKCADGYRCFYEETSKVVWVMKKDGNVNGPSCQQVCENALSQSDMYLSLIHISEPTRPY